MIKCSFPNKALCCRNKNSLFELEVLTSELEYFSLEECFVGFIPIPVRKDNFLLQEKRFFFHKWTSFPLDFMGLKEWRLAWSIKLFFLTDKCSKLTPDNKCSIYGNRPLLCRGFPLLTTVPEVVADPLHFCRKCGKVEITEPDKYLKRLEKLYIPRLKQHRKVFESLTQEFVREFPVLGESLIEIIEAVQTMPHEDYQIPINLGMNALFCSVLFGVKGLKVQAEVLKKLIEKYRTLNPADVEPMAEMLRGYEETIKALKEG